MSRERDEHVDETAEGHEDEAMHLDAEVHEGEENDERENDEREDEEEEGHEENLS